MGKDLEKRENNDIGFKHLKINKIINRDKYLFFALDNGQNILTDGKLIYDVSYYDSFKDVFEMNDRVCAVMTKWANIYVVDLKRNEILFEDKDAYAVFKEDERSLRVLMHDAGNKLYTIDNKKYIMAPEGYEFYQSLGKGLYVFKEDDKHRKDYLNYKRLIMNIKGEILLKDIKGYIDFNNSHLIISEKEELKIAGISRDKNLDVKVLKKDDKFLAIPQYYKGNILAIEKNSVKLYDTYLKIVKDIAVDNLEIVLDSEWVGDVLKILVPYQENGREINKHVFVDLKNDKVLSHIRIEAYPYWEPTTFIGRDTPDFEKTYYYFYNKNSELICKIKGDFYESINEEKNLFLISTREGNKTKKQLLNSENGSIREINYDLMSYTMHSPYGWGVNLEKETMDFFNENLEIVIPNFNYKKYDLSLASIGDAFSYFIINDYLCIVKHVIDDFGRSQYRSIIYKSNGKEVMDSYKHRCYPLGNYIQIISDCGTQFINTLNGEIGDLEIGLPTKENGEIDFDKLIDINERLRVNSNAKSRLSLDDKTNKR